MKMVLLDLDVDPGVADDYASSLPAVFEATRAFPGCLSIDAYRDDGEPGRIVVVEHWDSVDNYEKYLAWRRQTGGMDRSAKTVRKMTAGRFTRIE